MGMGLEAIGVDASREAKTSSVNNTLQSLVSSLQMVWRWSVSCKWTKREFFSLVSGVVLPTCKFRLHKIWVQNERNTLWDFSFSRRNHEEYSQDLCFL